MGQSPTSSTMEHFDFRGSQWLVNAKSQDAQQPGLDFTLSATTPAKIGGRQISGSSAIKFGFHVISHCHGDSWQMPNLRIIWTSLDFTSSAIVTAKVNRCQILGPSTVRLGFHIISHCHGKSSRTTNPMTLIGQVWLLHHQPPSWRKLAGAKSQNP